MTLRPPYCLPRIESMPYSSCCLPSMESNRNPRSDEHLYLHIPFFPPYSSSMRECRFQVYPSRESGRFFEAFCIPAGDFIGRIFNQLRQQVGALVRGHCCLHRNLAAGQNPLTDGLRTETAANGLNTPFQTSALNRHGRIPRVQIGFDVKQPMCV